MNDKFGDYDDDDDDDDDDEYTLSCSCPQVHRNNDKARQAFFHPRL